MEHGAIEQPINPTIRLVRRAFDADGRPIGLVVVNIRAQRLLDIVESVSALIPADRLYLLNDEGYWLVGPNPAEEWAFMHSGRQHVSFATRSPDAWRRIRAAEQASVAADGGTYLSSSFSPTSMLGRRPVEAGERAWTLVAFRSDAALEGELAEQRELIAFASFGSGLAFGLLFLGVSRLAQQSRLRREAEVTAREAEAAAREQALEHQKTEAIVTIAGGVGHEFNNILTAILGFAYLLRESLKDPGQLEKVGTIVSAGERAARLVKHLMTFAQVDVPDNRPLSLRDVVAEQAEEISRTLPERVHLEVDVADAPMRMRADASKLADVVQHLVSNAADAVEEVEEPRIELSLELDPSARGEDGRLGALLTVADNGCGIAEEKLPFIFDPFSSTKAPGAGTGLGLAFVYGVVHSLNGEIETESAVGEGTTIRIWLPLDEEG